MAKKPISNFIHSMSCDDSPSIQERRRKFKKEYSEDWFINDDRKSTLIDLNNKPSVLVSKKFQVETNKSRGKMMMMSRHFSLEKESILSSTNKKENKAPSELLTLNQNKNKPNLEIYLNTQQDILAAAENKVELDIKPKCLQRLSLTNNYQIKKLSSPKNKQITLKPNNTIVVIPIIKKTPPPTDETIINVLVQNRRESSHYLTKKSPLIRSSSAPALYKTPDKSGKFLAIKKKVKKPCCTNKTHHHQPSSSEWSNNGSSVQTQQSEIVTMISLISDNEEESNDDDNEPEGIKTRPKSALKKELDEEFNKTSKSVSFHHQSGRSFSASFPTRRRGSLSTTTTQLIQERRTTTTNNPGHGLFPKKVNKKRLMVADDDDDNKNNMTDEYYLEDDDDNLILISSPTTRQNQRNNTSKEDTQQQINNDNDDNKEKQCWEMYRKITEKGIGISYDTILRGILTPTEYRIQKKALLVKEFTL